MKGNRSQTREAWELAWSLGFQIAIPLVVFALLGRVLDNKLNTGPWFFLIGVLVAIIVTSALVYKKVKSIMSEMDNEANKNKSDNNNNLINK